MPIFKKSGGKIFGVQFNKAEQRALDHAINEQKKSMGLVLCRNPEATGILPDGSGG